MGRALDLARRGIGLTSPNPCVGAVLVREGRTIGEGWHHRAGEAHAEVLAIRQALRRGEQLAGSTLYITLEPCCTHGRTPPCTDLIIREHIKRVVVAATDPNPRHAGRAYRLMRQAGIEVTTGVAADAAKELNRAFNHWIVHHLPWVVGKLALSLDGRIVGRSGDDRWLTSLAARRLAHRLRGESDAIVIGAGTARKDNPALTVRLAKYQRKTQPWRVILTRSGKLSRRLQVFIDDYRERTLVYKNLPLGEVLKDLGNREVISVLIEGGGELLGQAIAEGLVNEVCFFMAPVILGSSNEGLIWPKRLKVGTIGRPNFQKIGPDILCRANILPL